jgi:ammonium transporter Rh
MIRPFGAMIIGSIAGILSTVGFAKIKPVLQKFRAHDTCGVNNLHGMPGILAGIFGIILAAFPAASLHTYNLSDTCWHGHERSALMQVGYQAAALGLTILIAVVGGIITGIILRLPLLNDELPSSYHNDNTHWKTPDDFHQGATVPFHEHIDPHV